MYIPIFSNRMLSLDCLFFQISVIFVSVTLIKNFVVFSILRSIKLRIFPVSLPIVHNTHLFMYRMYLFDNKFERRSRPSFWNINFNYLKQVYFQLKFRNAGGGRLWPKKRRDPGKGLVHIPYVIADQYSKC